MIELVYEIAIFCFVLMSFFFSASETAVMSANKLHLKSLSEKRKFGALMALRITEKSENAIAAILIGNNIANIGTTVLVAYVANTFYQTGPEELFIISAVLTVFLLLFGEIMPKIFARAKTSFFICYFSYAINAVITILKPLVFISLSLSSIAKRLFKTSSDKSFLRSREEIGLFFKIGEQTGVIKRDYKEYVDEILQMNEVMVKEIMTPTIDIVSIESGDSIKDVVRIIDKTHFFIFFLYEKRVDNIIGYISFKDLFMNPSSIKNVIKPAIYVPETKLIYELYHEFLNNGIMMVFVVNEHGAVTGLATREDIAEEIFGEIQTREHESNDFVSEIAKGKYLVDASLDIDIFEKIFSLKIDKRNYDTVAGFIMWLSGKIPKTGEKYIYEGCEITISESDNRSIKSVTVRKRTS